jgi:hypothetical protein
MCIAFWLRSGPNDYVLWIMSWNSHDGLPFHTHIGTYKTYIQSNKVRQDHVILDEKWKRKRKIRHELSHIPIRLRWFLIVGFSAFSCEAKFLCLFHSNGVYISLHSPSKTYDILPWGIYATSIATLFWPPCLNTFFHSKLRLEKGDCAELWTWMDWNIGAHLTM